MICKCIIKNSTYNLDFHFTAGGGAWNINSSVAYNLNAYWEVTNIIID